MSFAESTRADWRQLDRDMAEGPRSPELILHDALARAERAKAALQQWNRARVSPGYAEPIWRPYDAEYERLTKEKEAAEEELRELVTDMLGVDCRRIWDALS